LLVHSDDVLGEGAFKRVYAAMWGSTPVAVAVLVSGGSSVGSDHLFVKEAETIRTFALHSPLVYCALLASVCGWVQMGCDIATW